MALDQLLSCAVCHDGYYWQVVCRVDRRMSARRMLDGKKDLVVENRPKHIQDPTGTGKQMVKISQRRRQRLPGPPTCNRRQDCRIHGLGFL